MNGDIILWRGAKNIQARNDFLDNGGTELAPMSTTTDLDVALGYLSGIPILQGPGIVPPNIPESCDLREHIKREMNN